jgi:hypothetical protein
MRRKGARYSEAASATSLPASKLLEFCLQTLLGALAVAR